MTWVKKLIQWFKVWWRHKKIIDDFEYQIEVHREARRTLAKKLDRAKHEIKELKGKLNAIQEFLIDVAGPSDSSVDFTITDPPRTDANSCVRSERSTSNISTSSGDRVCIRDCKGIEQNDYCCDPRRENG